MLEIIIVWQLCKKIGQIVRDKGRSAGGYQFLTVALWVGGEIFGGIVGFVLTGNEEPGLAVYALALLGAIVGAGISFAIVASLSSLAQDDEWDRLSQSCRSCGERLQGNVRVCPVCGENPWA